jgi:peptidyl-prolyl cis-trans isomerase D
MLASFRRFADTLVAKVFFAILVAAFAFWGVAGGISDVTEDRAIAVVGSKRITPDMLSVLYQRNLQQALHSMGTTIDSTPEIRRAVAQQSLDRMIMTTALTSKAQDFGLAVPDDALRQAVFDVPAFHGASGQFDRATFEQLLRNNNYTEQRFLDDMRQDMLQRQLLLPLRADATVPEVMADAYFRLQYEQRVALAAEVPFSRAVPPPAPTDAQLQRFYENNSSRYTTKETRRARIIVLSPQTLASQVQVSDADVKAAYDARQSEFSVPPKRSVQVLLTQSEDTAKSLAAQWASDKTWAQMQDIAQKAGAGPVELSDATQVEFPSPELGQAVFAADLNSVSAPVKSALGWYVVKVVGITPGANRSLADVAPELRARLIAEKAGDMLYERANKIEDALAGGTTLENLPGDLGVAAVEGTLDAQGNTPDGKPAPIPGPDELRPALVQAIFQAKKGDPAQLVQAPNAKDGTQSFYAFEIEDISPVAVRPFADVQIDVRADWTRDQKRHEQEVIAAGMITAMKSGKTLEKAAADAGYAVEKLPPVGRDSPPQGVSAQLAGQLFSLKVGEPTMAEDATGFTVAVLDSIVVPDPAKDPANLAHIKDELATSIAGDTEGAFLMSVRNAAKPRVNTALLNQMAQAE